jgi:hypothetical protein
MARCHGNIRKAARVITIGETATSKCDSAATLSIRSPHRGYRVAAAAI